MSYDAVDLFAGPGGWDVAAASLDIATVGIEWDHAACLTARVAGHARVRADVAAYPPEPFRGIPGLIGSPPCTLFSMAGSGIGRLVLDVLTAGISSMLHGDDRRDKVRDAIYPVALAEREAVNAKKAPTKRRTPEQLQASARTDAFIAALVLEPARWIVAMSPEWVALEQVPAVLPLWQAYVRGLRSLGYSAWTGVVNSADYGVPQTRERAICMASRTRTVQPPEPTHSPDGCDGDLFGNGREKWVSMAKALGWDTGDRLRHPRGEGMTERHGPREDRTGDEPSMTLTGKARSWEHFVVDRRTNSRAAGGTSAPTVPVSVTRPAPTLTGKSGEQWVVRPDETPPVYVNGNQPNAGRRSADEPAPTVLFGNRSNDVRWVLGERGVDLGQDGVAGGVLAGVDIDEGAEVGDGLGAESDLHEDNDDSESEPVNLAGENSSWAFTRPATTVVGSYNPDVIAAPGYRTQVSRQNAEGSVRVSVAEAGVLQSFPTDYPWQGSRTKQFQQVGNAVPPCLAAHVLAALTGERP